MIIHMKKSETPIVIELEGSVIGEIKILYGKNGVSIDSKLERVDTKETTHYQFELPNKE